MHALLKDNPFLRSKPAYFCHQKIHTRSVIVNQYSVALWQREPKMRQTPNCDLPRHGADPIQCHGAAIGIGFI